MLEGKTTLPDVHILHAQCKGCTLCVRKCPAKAITGERKMPHSIAPEKCTRCGECAKVCKFNAIAGLMPHNSADISSNPIEYHIGENCTGCTICAQNCPVSAIPWMPYRRHSIDTSVCINCDVCREHCPNDAVRTSNFCS